MMYEKIKRLAAAEGISIASLEKKLNIRQSWLHL